MASTDSVILTHPVGSGAEIIYSTEALEFIRHLHCQFNTRRQTLLERRHSVQRQLDLGQFPDFPKSTAQETPWQVAEAPDDLLDRRVEITGPVDRKMMINALNSGAKVFMADFEDSLSPTWENVSQGQLCLYEAVRKTLSYTSPTGQHYSLKAKTATLVVRPRGWHLHDAHVCIDGEAVSASLLDFGLYFFHNTAALIKQNSGPYFYLPKMENHLEARLWNDVFVESQKYLGIPQGSIRATVLIETILAAFEMEEILYELKDHAAGLNAGRWDYIFSMIKKFRHHPQFVFPDRSQVTMDVPFMRAYAQRLVKVCHTHGAHAIGGMAAFIPNRKDQALTERAFNAVRHDKVREAQDGFDGTWVAHPDLVPVAMEIFDQVLGARPNQKHQLREDVQISRDQLLDVNIPDAKVTKQGVETNIRVALHYLTAWLDGQGAVAINNLMEDAATAEISRTQLWQWLHYKTPLDGGGAFSTQIYTALRQKALDDLSSSLPSQSLPLAAKLLDHLVLSDRFEDFLTIPGYAQITQQDHISHENCSMNHTYGGHSGMTLNNNFL